MSEKHMHIVPDGYVPSLGLVETQEAIKLAKDGFERRLAEGLNLLRVSAPLFVDKKTGLNDDLNGVERPVSFDLLEQPGIEVQVVQSLAKWKRFALGKYGMEVGRGLYTDMNAIRRDEETDNLHSVYVDQWDWEKVITREMRTLDTLKEAVRAIHRALQRTKCTLNEAYPSLKSGLPKEIAFVTSQELEDRWPELSSMEREDRIAKECGAVCIMQIGDKLKSGIRHDGRAPDYDDWSLNADLVYYHAPLDCKLEISSMGIRVDEAALLAQLEKAGCQDRAQLPFHKALLAGQLPLTMGGGIGQSRLCMLLLEKCHVGEVQASIWPKEAVEDFAKKGVTLL